jgi:hypothetical protein
MEISYKPKGSSTFRKISGQVVEEEYLLCYDPEYGERGHDKFYLIRVLLSDDGATWYTIAAFGRVGNNPMMHMLYEGASRSRAETAYFETVAAKMGHGYTRQGS